MSNPFHNWPIDPKLWEESVEPPADSPVRNLIPKELKTVTPVEATAAFDPPLTEYEKQWAEFCERMDAAGAYTIMSNGTRCYGLTNFPERLFDTPKDPKPDVIAENNDGR